MIPALRAARVLEHAGVHQPAPLDEAPATVLTGHLSVIGFGPLGAILRFWPLAGVIRFRPPAVIGVRPLAAIGFRPLAAVIELRAVDAVLRPSWPLTGLGAPYALIGFSGPRGPRSGTGALSPGGAWDEPPSRTGPLGGSPAEACRLGRGGAWVRRPGCRPRSSAGARPSRPGSRARSRGVLSAASLLPSLDEVERPPSCGRPVDPTGTREAQGRHPGGPRDEPCFGDQGRAQTAACSRAGSAG